MKFGVIFSFVMCLCVLSSCDKDDAAPGGIDESPPVADGSGGDITTMIVPQQNSVTFPYSIHKEVGYKDLELYPVDGTGEVTLRSSIYPFYAFENTLGSNGDYYLVKAEVSVFNENMYKGFVTHLYKKDAYGGNLRVSTNICGYYLREIRVSYRLNDRDGNEVGEFPVNHSPSPLTTIGSTTYTSGFSWSIGAQLRIGISDTTAKGSLLFGLSYDSNVERNIHDMDVRNSSTDNTPIYAFVLNKLPASDPQDGGYMPKLPPPALSVSSGTYMQEFIWRVPTTRDSQGDDVRFTIEQTVELDYGLCYSVRSPIGQGPRELLKEEVTTITKTSFIDVTPPCRIPMGKLKVTNKNKGQYITQVTFTKEGETKPRAASKGSFAYGKSYEEYVDIGRYNVEFKMGKTLQDAKTYTIAGGQAEVCKDETLELFSDYDFMIK